MWSTWSHMVQKSRKVELHEQRHVIDIDTPHPFKINDHPFTEYWNVSSNYSHGGHLQIILYWARDLWFIDFPFQKYSGKSDANSSQLNRLSLAYIFSDCLLK